MATKASVSVTVTNTGGVAGSEVVQLYSRFPANAGEPPQQLKAFTKVALAAGASAVVGLPLSQRSWSVWSIAKHAWVVVPGVYGIGVGGSSRDIRLVGTVKI